MQHIAKKLLLTGFITLCIWSLFSWPLPKHVREGIPSSAHNVEKDGVRRMAAGDHLQLHYFYWIFSDMLAGKTPFWHNLYEFNIGDDAARRQVGNYNMPFSLLYAGARPLAGEAFGWNLTGFASLWGTLLFAWLLAKRYTNEDRLSLICALLSISLPYRWMALLGGSPTGFAMLWVPALFLGLDMAGRDDDFYGSILASTAIMLTYWNDPHTFFFSVLILPAGYLLGFVRREQFPRPRQWGRIVWALVPVTLVVVGMGMVGMVVKHATFAGTTMAQGRTVSEIVLYAPGLRGLLGRHTGQPHDQIFIGYVLLGMMVLHALCMPWRWRQVDAAQKWQFLALRALLYGSIAGIVMLSMGTQGPFDAWVFRAARRLVPGFSMIRQTAKIYALLPPLLVVAAALALRDIAPWRGRRTWLLLLPILAVVLDHRVMIQPTVCLLDREQSAYAAVRADAIQDDNVPHPHALVVPVWPGDTHWSSLYQHYASLYRIRMVNGYSPIVSQQYIEDIYEPLQSANNGILHDDQLDALLEMGVHYVVFHEDAYPEQISAYPAIVTLRRLLRHPRLKLLQQGQSIWSFRIRHALVTDNRFTDLPDGPYFPSLRWNAATEQIEGGEVRTEASTWGGRFVRLHQGHTLQMHRPFNHMYAPMPQLWIRARGDGVLQLSPTLNDETATQRTIQSPDWIWLLLALPITQEQMHFRAEVLAGEVDVDMLTLIAGGWEPPESGQQDRLPACLFFRSGYTNADQASVSLRPHYDAASVVFYGPRLPYNAGHYGVELQYASTAEAGTILGYVTASDGWNHADPVEVRAGKSAAQLQYKHTSNMPIEMQFRFSGKSHIELQAVVFDFQRRLSDNEK